jgi:hypothetical protein
VASSPAPARSSPGRPTAPRARAARVAGGQLQSPRSWRPEQPWPAGGRGPGARPPVARMRRAPPPRPRRSHCAGAAADARVRAARRWRRRGTRREEPEQRRAPLKRAAMALHNPQVTPAAAWTEGPALGGGRRARRARRAARWGRRGHAAGLGPRRAPHRRARPSRPQPRGRAPGPPGGGRQGSAPRPGSAGPGGASASRGQRPSPGRRAGPAASAGTAAGCAVSPAHAPGRFSPPARVLRP